MSGRCRVLPLEVNRNAIRFRWDIDPAHAAWVRSGFSVEYEPDVDLTSVPRSLLWSVFLGATHPIWSLLDGYTVEFDEPISGVELAFWNEMAAASRIAFDVPRAAPDPPGVRFVSLGGDPEPAPRSARAAGPPAVLLSCGKESLLSLGLLREVRGEAVGINIESPMTGSHDHQSAFREWALGALGKLPGITIRRIRSDIRSAWGKNDYAEKRGGGAYLNELADAMLYASFALPIAYQHRFSWIVAGSEWGDVTTLLGDQEMDARHVPRMASDRWQFDRFFTSTGPALSAVNALWEPRYGVGYTSVILAISQYLVQRILLRRYPDLAAFQHSCYRAQPDVRACQACDKCFRVTALALASATDPAIVGMDVNRVFSRWSAAAQFEIGAAAAHYESFDHMTGFALASADESFASGLFKPHTIDDFLKFKPWRARRRLRRIRARLGAVPAKRLDTVKRGYLDYLPVQFRDPIQRILEAAAPYDDEADADVHAERAFLIAALTEPLSRDAR